MKRSFPCHVHVLSVSRRSEFQSSTLDFRPFYFCEDEVLRETAMNRYS